MTEEEKRNARVLNNKEYSIQEIAYRLEKDIKIVKKELLTRSYVNENGILNLK